MLIKYKEAILYTIFILVGFVYSITLVRPKIEEIINIENQIGTKNVQSADLERQIETLKQAESTKSTASGQLKSIYKPAEAGLDTESSFTVMFDDIIDMAKYNGIKIYSIEYIYNPTEDEFVKGAAEKYNVCQLNMSIIADYTDLEGFVKELYKYPYLININKLELVPYAKNKKIILTNLQLKLYSQK